MNSVKSDSSAAEPGTSGRPGGWASVDSPESRRLIAEKTRLVLVLHRPIYSRGDGHPDRPGHSPPSRSLAPDAECVVGDVGRLVLDHLELVPVRIREPEDRAPFLLFGRLRDLDALLAESRLLLRGVCRGE